MENLPADDRRPPAIDGVTAGTLRLPAAGPATVLEFLAARFADVPEETWRQRFRRGRVLDGASLPLPEDAPFQPGMCVHYYREIEAEPEIPFAATILHLDARLLIADKPHFLPVVPSGRFVRETLLARLRRDTGIEALSPLHRIDRGTAGLVAFAVNPQHRGAYQRLFAERAVEKRYQAIAAALPDRSFPLMHRSRLVAGEPFFRMREVPGEPNSETHIEVAKTDGYFSRYALRPVTGRKHQLRVHMAALGAPILGDDFYPDLLDRADDDYTQPLQLLAKALAFVDPVDGRKRAFETSRELKFEGALPAPKRSV